MPRLSDKEVKLKALRKGLEAITTLRGLVDRFHTRTPHGALIELARLKQERARLQEELRRWARRIEQIKGRLEEIGEIEPWLYKLAGNAQESPGPAPIESGQAEGEKKPLDVPAGLREVVLRY